MKLQTAMNQMFPGAEKYISRFADGMVEVRITQGYPNFFEIARVCLEDGEEPKLYWAGAKGVLPQSIKDELLKLLDSHHAAMPWKERDLALEIAWVIAWAKIGESYHSMTSTYVALPPGEDVPLDRVGYNYGPSSATASKDRLTAKDLEKRLVQYLQSVKAQCGRDAGKFWTEVMCRFS